MPSKAWFLESTTGMIKTSPSKFEEFCPVCTRCIADDAPTCPDCASPRPTSGWRALQTAPYAYLGKEFDGRYVVDRFAGAGATGDVYRAVGTRIPRQFALKIVDTRRHTRQEDPDEIARRLRMEVEAMGRIRNPHVVGVYELMQIHEHVFAMVMDFVDGITLQQRLDRVGRLGVSEAVEIIRQVANGLHEAHQRGIIHRDIKPDNIMIEEMPASGIFARVLDFGIAYMVGSVSVTSGFRGTPLYASPEQCRADGVVDASSDVYSLGCVLFHLLAGRPPYLFERALAMMEAHVEAPVPSLYDYVAPGAVPDDLVRLVERMLAKNPADRPQDAGEVVRALDALQLGEARRAHMQLAAPTEVTSSELGAEGTDTDAPPTTGVLGAGIAGGDTTDSAARRAVHLLASYELEEQVELDHAAPAGQLLGPGGDYAVLIDTRGPLRLRGLKVNFPALVFSPAPCPLTAVCVDLQRGDIYAGGGDQHIYHWRLDRSGDAPEKLIDVGAPIRSMDCHSPGSQLAVGTSSGEVLRIDLRTQRTSSLFKGNVGVCRVKFIPAADWLLAACEDGQLSKIAWRDAARTELMRLAVTQDAPRTLAVCPHGRRIAVLTASGRLHLIDLEGSDSPRVIEASYARLSALAYAGDGSLNALGIVGRKLQLWQIHCDLHPHSTAVAPGESI